MTSSSFAFSGAASSEIATSSTYRRAMSKQASRHLYNYRLNTPEPQDAYSSTSTSSHHRKSTHTTQNHSSTHQSAYTQNHRASRQLTTAITPPRRHPGISLPEASASQHQAMYLEYLDLVAAGKIIDPVNPPDYQNYGSREEEEVPEFAPPSYEQKKKKKKKGGGVSTNTIITHEAGNTIFASTGYSRITTHTTRHSYPNDSTTSTEIGEFLL
ncbi:hypothetical protein D6D04_09516 [Aureobasidium pullulans]|nr:hypothetical protein D6D04_09516 [Aureobasidium pullulans]